MATGRLTSVDGPHDAEGRATDLVVGLLAGDDLPQDDGPAEHVTLLTVVAACREQRHCTDPRSTTATVLSQPRVSRGGRYVIVCNVVSKKFPTVRNPDITIVADQIK